MDCLTKLRPSDRTATVDKSTVLRRSKQFLFAIDLTLTRSIAVSARRPIVRLSVIGIGKLGNGGLYLILPILVLIRCGWGGVPAIVVSIGAVTVLHGFYPYVKRRVGRARPYQADSTLHTLFDVLDEYSFPSGHTMTLSAALMPVIYVIPGSTSLAAGIIGVMGWARVASAHHYPSDVCAGAIIGGSLSYAASMCFLNPL